jgi:uncharacterized protein (TIGR03437 family)
LRTISVFPAGVVGAAGQTSGVISAGAWVSIFGLNLTADGGPPAVMLTDATAREWALPVSFASPTQLNLFVPVGVRPGSATIGISAPGGTARASVRVDDAAPGLFTPDGQRYGTAAFTTVLAGGDRVPGYSCDAAGACTLQPVPGSGLLEFVAGGLGPAGPVSLRVAGYALDVVELIPTETAGLHLVRARVPEGVSLRGYLPVRITAAGRTSSPVYVWLR